MLLVSSMHAGGAERVAATLANAWALRGESVTLVPTFSGRGRCFYPLVSDVNLVWLADSLGSPRPRVSASLRKLRALRRLVRNQQPDVIISFLTNVNVMVLLGTAGLRIPVIACERTNPGASTNVGRVLGWLRRLLYGRASMVTVQAVGSVEPMRRLAPRIRALEVIANPLPPELPDHPLATRVRDASGRYRLAAMGRFVPAKQFDQLVQAFTGLADQFPDWDLVIWGDGPQRGALTRQIQGSGMSHRIFLPGRTDKPWDALASVHAFALVSAVEGFPNVLLEAMALGLPCLAVDCPSGPREMTREGEDALLVPPADMNALVQGLRRLMRDDALRDTLARRAAFSVRQRYSLPAILAQWDDLMEKAGVRAGSGSP
jgi:glycosyltransferase involved in cell wall biosynthesis